VIPLSAVVVLIILRTDPQDCHYLEHFLRNRVDLIDPEVHKLGTVRRFFTFGRYAISARAVLRDLPF
jgi:hypothetical protein